ncbi:MAG: PilZ domain-containing protein [Deltaproteobacteria bacterium]|nr:PilZ domain-containing protein [Deltaproteobacteria bacterium]
MSDQNDNQGTSVATGIHHRKTERLAWDEPVEFLSPVKCTGRALDIGAGGIGVEVAETLPMDSLVEMKILHGHLIVQGRVRWISPAENGVHRVGVQFDHEDISILTHLRHLMQAKT